jgi:hypothetical protein
MEQLAYIQNYDADSVRTALGMHSTNSPGLEGRSNMQDDYDDNEEQGTTTDEDLMPYVNAPINPAVRAFQESGHGVQIKKGREGQ